LGLEPLQAGMSLDYFAIARALDDPPMTILTTQLAGSRTHTTSD
jgi:hypothetical protein